MTRWSDDTVFSLAALVNNRNGEGERARRLAAKLALEGRMQILLFLVFLIILPPGNRAIVQCHSVS